MTKKILLCGASGFIGRNLLETLAQDPGVELYAARHKTALPADSRVRVVDADLTAAADVDRAVAGMDAVVQAAAVTSGAKEIVSTPHIHVADNAVMNALLFRACHEHGVGHVVYFSCTVMYSPKDRPVIEDDFDHRIGDKYFGAGWTKVYAEKMCEFYSRLGRTRYTVLRHSNVYGPHDKYDLERSHVFGATVAKVMGAQDGKVLVWGEGTEERDLLHVDDLVALVRACLAAQKTPFELVNAGSGESVSVAELVRRIITASEKKLSIEFDRTKPTIPFKLAVDSSRAKSVFGWKAKTGLDDGIRKTLRWYEGK